MPLIILCGHPSSGKTHRAKQIIRYLEHKINGTAADETERNGVAEDATTVSVDSTANELSESNLKDATSNGDASKSSSRHDVPSATANTIPSSSSFRNTTPLASSRSTVANQPSQRTTPSRPTRNTRKIYYISDHTLHLPRSAYATSRTEKDARAALYSAVKRMLTRNDVVVLDSGNYIKGWRYQLYCEAKNTGTASCVVHVGVPADKCREVNEARLQKSTEDEKAPNTGVVSPNEDRDDPGERTERSIAGSSREGDPYETSVFEELLMRFEEPNAMARWDSPLFTVPWEDASPPCEQIWREVVQGVGKDGKSRVIRPNQAAVLTPATSSTHLYTLDRTTLSILKAIQTHQQANADPSSGEQSSAGGTVRIPRPGPTSSPTTGANSNSTADTSPDTSVNNDNDEDPKNNRSNDQMLTLTLPQKPLTFPALQRLRRQFIALHRQQMGGLGMGGIGGGIMDRSQSNTSNTSASTPGAGAGGGGVTSGSGSGSSREVGRGGGGGGAAGLSEARVAELFVGFLGERFEEMV